MLNNETHTLLFYSENIELVFEAITVVQFSIGNLSVTVLSEKDLQQLFIQSSSVGQRCLPQHFLESQCNSLPDCTATSSFNYLQTKAVTIGAAAGTAAAAGGGCSCGVFAVVFLFYRRKKSRSPVDEALIASINLDEKHGSIENELHEAPDSNAIQNPLFQ